MQSISIKAENISKAYQLGQIGTGTMSRDLERWFAKIRGKEDPYLKIGETNDRSTLGKSDIVWSLKDINFEINQGDAVGIIGRNGAGKSTLLKVLSKITSPTAGKISGKGRIASLLEVGTGFHPELSGKENIFLNGAILGMRKKEISRKLSEIVEFAGVERYLDTPVKRYSSGMYVRLAFAVAAHLESEILIVDEVLAVGDAEFQKKCLGKMNEVSKAEGRTVLFVSHNMGAVRTLCQKTLLLDQGRTQFFGPTNLGIHQYLSLSSKIGSAYEGDKLIKNGFTSAEIRNELGERSANFAFDENIIVSFNVSIQNAYKSAFISLRFTNSLEQIIFTTEKEAQDFVGDHRKIEIKIPNKVLLPNSYKITMALHIPNIQLIHELENVLSFEILETGSEFYHYSGTDFGCVNVNCNWTTL